MLKEAFDQLGNTPIALKLRTKIERRAKQPWLVSANIRGPKMGGEPQITRNRLQDMLPRPRSLAISNRYRFPRLHRSNDVRDNSIGCPIASANHISCTCRGNLDQRIGLREKRRSISCCNQLRATLRCTVRIITAHGILFPVGVQPLFVLVAFVRCYDHDRTSFGISDKSF